MPPRRSTLLHQSVQPTLAIPSNPYIPGLPRDLIALAQLRHRPMTLFILKNKPHFLFHHTARFPWHALFFNSRLAILRSVRYPPGLFCQGCARSVPSYPPPPPPYVHPFTPKVTQSTQESAEGRGPFLPLTADCQRPCHHPGLG